MEIRVLRYFLAVAREGNIAGAAAFLHLTQPTLSRQIRDLEEELGQTLLVRKSHGVALTAEGMLFRKRARRYSPWWTRPRRNFASMGEAVSGEVYIGGGETQQCASSPTLPARCARFIPGCAITCSAATLRDVTERLDKGLIDFE